VRFASSLDALNANDEALAAWEKTVELAGRNVLNWCGRGQCLERMGRLEDALASHDKALAIDPRFSIGKFHKGRLEAELGRRDAAILAFQQFLALAPPNLAALVNEARKRLQELKA
jgi:tetratricopeptide (TPR) repeat protein